MRHDRARHRTAHRPLVSGRGLGQHLGYRRPHVGQPLKRPLATAGAA
ncbi:hypothetical protein [Streptomyces sp. NL15-2K]|nr:MULTISPECIES: hypothetical protein [Actinomycetes]WKX12234.1 hypothetical protein Q4V64_33820 [Kutzneria buriramensis]